MRTNLEAKLCRLCFVRYLIDSNQKCVSYHENRVTDRSQTNLGIQLDLFVRRNSTDRQPVASFQQPHISPVE